MSEVIETELDYVIRKLNDEATNILVTSEKTEVNRAALIRIKNGDSKDPGFKVVQKLYKYFKSLAD
jgi:hypothetical protein